MKSQPLKSDAQKLREYLLQHDGHDFGLTDAELEELAQQARKWVSRRRWSWTVVARNIVKDGKPHAGL